MANSEGGITRVRAAVPPPGEARDDWAIVVDFARRLEQRLRPPYLARTATLFPYTSAEDIFNEHRETTRGRDLDITGLSSAFLDPRGAQQWPLRQPELEGALPLYADWLFPTPPGRPRFPQPALKHAAVRIESAGLSWPLIAFGYAPDGDVLALLERVRTAMPHFPFSSCTLIGRDPGGVLLHVAAERAPAPESIACVDALFALEREPVLRYDDARRGISRRVRICDGRVIAARLAGDVQTATRLKDWLVRREPL